MGQVKTFVMVTTDPNYAGKASRAEARFDGLCCYYKYSPTPKKSIFKGLAGTFLIQQICTFHFKHRSTFLCY